MNTFQQLTVLLGWTAVINIGFLFLAFFVITVMKEPVVSIHKKISGLSEEALSLTYFQYLANYKILIFVFNLAPYAALKIMGY